MIARTKNIPTNMTVPKLLLERLLDKTNNRCLSNQYYGVSKMKKDYELAYEIFYYLGSTQNTILRLF